MEYAHATGGSVGGGTDLPTDPPDQSVPFVVRLLLWDGDHISRFRVALWAVTYFGVGFAQLFRTTPEPVIGAFFMAASLPMIVYWKKGEDRWGFVAFSAVCIVSLARAGAILATYLLGRGTWHGTLIVLLAWTLLGMKARSNVAFLLKRLLGSSA